jgi:hypothetical protein
MKKTFTTTRIIAVTLMALLVSAAQARAAVTVYADDMVSNTAVNASAPEVVTNVPAQTNLNTTSQSQGSNPQVRVDETGVHIGGPNPVDINAPAFLRHREGGMDVTGIIAILSTFGMPVLIILIVFYTKHRRNRMAHETLRAMIDKGMPITPELVAEIRSKGPSAGGLYPQRGNRLFPGLVLVGIGAALLLAGHGDTKGGLIVLFIGLAFLVAWAVERKHSNDTQPPLR